MAEFNITGRHGSPLNQNDDKNLKAKDEESSEVEDSVVSEIVSRCLALVVPGYMYEYALYDVVHAAGFRKQEEEEALLEHLKTIFKADKETHLKFLEKARNKKPPSIFLNVDIIEGEVLMPSDKREQCFPFCSLYLLSDSSNQLISNTKDGTIHPVWRESFTVSLPNREEDILCIEMWNCKPGILKASEEGGSIAKLVEESFISMADQVTGQSSRQGCDFIGCAEVDLKTVPVLGDTMWVVLEDEESSKENIGSVKIKLSFSTEKSHRVGVKEYENLFYSHVLHEAESLKTGEGWSGQLSAPGDILLQQHAVQTRMTEKDVAWARWVTLSHVNICQVVSRATLNNALLKLMAHVNAGELSHCEMFIFLRESENIFLLCSETLKELWKLPAKKEDTIDYFKNTLSILKALHSVHEASLVSRFKWLELPPGCESRSAAVQAVTQGAITQGAQHWYEEKIEKIKVEGNAEEPLLRRQIEVIREIREGLQNIAMPYEGILAEEMQLSCVGIMFMAVEPKIKETTEPLVRDLCTKIEPLNSSKPREPMERSRELARGLFDLYTQMQLLAKFLISEGGTGFSFNHTEWFQPVVITWVQSVKHEVTNLPDRAGIEPTTATLQEYHKKMKTFWQELAWPVHDELYEFLCEALDNEWTICNHVAEHIVTSINDAATSTQGFVVTPEWCSSVNDLAYMRSEYGVDTAKYMSGGSDVRREVSDDDSSVKAKDLREALLEKMSSRTKELDDKLAYVIGVLSQKISYPVVTKLKEAAQSKKHEVNDSILEYLNKTVSTLKPEMCAQHLNTVLEKTFQNFLSTLDGFVKLGMEKKRSIAYFENLKNLLSPLMDLYFHVESTVTNEPMMRLKFRLGRLVMSTQDLITEVAYARLNDQKDMTEAPLGVLTVNLMFEQETLHIEVLYAKNLLPMDVTGTSDPYVTITLLPRNRFENVKHLKTKAVKNNLSPVFNESFKIPLTKEQRSTPDAMLLFMVKDQDFYVTSEYIGEAYVTFREIAKEQPLTTHLKLSVPSDSNLESFIMKVLSSREGDSLAQDFVKRQKSKHDHASVPTRLE